VIAAEAENAGLMWIYALGIGWMAGAWYGFKFGQNALRLPFVAILRSRPVREPAYSHRAFAVVRFFAGELAGD
jgi:hypothetical protein